MEDNFDNIKSTIIEKSLFFILLIVFFVQGAFFINAISQTVETWPIIYAKDNDAATAIRKSEISDWDRDNNYYNYGNLYFRLAHTLSKINPLDKSYLEDYKFSDEDDKNHHFSLMFVSLISLYGMSFLVSLLISRNINIILVSMILLNTIFMTNKYWISKVFGVHPDLLLCFFVALGVFSSIKYLTLFPFNQELLKKDAEKDYIQKEKYKDIVLISSGLIWGLALSVKLATLFFLPSLAILFFTLKKGEIKEKSSDLTKFFISLFIMYFLSGFPQNFEFEKLYTFIKYQSAYSISPTVESFDEWWNLLYKQYIPFLPFIFLLVAFFSEKTNNFFTKISSVKIFILSFLPFCFLLARNITSPHEHYTLPVVISFIIFTTYLLTNLKKLLIKKEIIHLKTNTNIFIPITLVLSILIVKYIPNSVSKAYDESQICKTEAQDLYNKIKVFQTNKMKVHVDPYVPFNQQLGYVRNNWFKTFDDIKPDSADILVLSKKYYSRYTESKEASHYIKQDTKNFEKIKEFYSLFNNNNQVRDIYGQEWKKIFYDNCGWEIWERVALLKSQ